MQLTRQVSDGQNLSALDDDPNSYPHFDVPLSALQVRS
jgi:hypothetical protein